MAKPGRVTKGDRAQILTRVPRPHRSVYEQRAAEEGLSLSDYVALVMARAHELDEPAYLARDGNQDALPIGA